MKFDKETVIVLVIAALILGAWYFYYPGYVQEQQEKAARQKQEQLQNQSAAAQTQAPAPAPAQEQTQTPAPAPAQEQTQTPAPAPAPEQTQAPVPQTDTPKTDAPADDKPVVLTPATAVLQNDLVKFTFDALDGTMISAEFLKFRKNVDSAEGENLILKPEGKAIRSFYMGPVLSGKPVSQPVVSCTEKDGIHTLTITRQLASYRVDEIFKLKNDSYTLDVSISITNTGKDTRVLSDLVFWVAGMPPVQIMSDDKINSVRHNVDFCLTNGDVDSFEPDFDDHNDLIDDYVTDESASWVGSTNKYFASLLFSKDNGFGKGLRFEQTLLNKMTIPSVGGAMSEITLAPGAVTTSNLQYYCGPKELSRVDELDETAMDAMHIAYWSWFEFIARPLARFLVWLGGLVGNYGIAIILLTLIVRALLWPMMQKSNMSMRKMQKIQPKMKELREKYKDNPQELNMRMMELYRTEGVNPLGGCLPLLLQIPIFFALYSVFDSAVELRHVSFLWAKDLAQPDGVGPVILGFQLHPLIIMMTILMIVQQKMTPSQMEPMQQKIMMAMPIIMLVMLYWLPSGLTLYWTISQAVSIIQLKYGQKLAEKEENKSSGNDNKKTAKAK